MAATFLESENDLLLNMAITELKWNTIILSKTLLCTYHDEYIDFVKVKACHLPIAEMNLNFVYDSQSERCLIRRPLHMSLAVANALDAAVERVPLFCAVMNGTRTVIPWVDALELWKVGWWVSQY